MGALGRTALLLAVSFCGSVVSYGQGNQAQILKPMARSADPDFEVATIRPADPNDRHQGFSLNGHRITIQNSTMTGLLCFAYSIHKSQIVNAPRWFGEES